MANCLNHVQISKHQAVTNLAVYVPHFRFLYVTFLFLFITLLQPRGNARMSLNLFWFGNAQFTNHLCSIKLCYIYLKVFLLTRVKTISCLFNLLFPRTIPVPCTHKYLLSEGINEPQLIANVTSLMEQEMGSFLC